MLIPTAVQEASLARNEAEQATALARAEAERCRELMEKLKEAARVKKDGDDDNCTAMAQRWVPRTCPLYAASLCPMLVLGVHQWASAMWSCRAVGIQSGGAQRDQLRGRKLGYCGKGDQLGGCSGLSQRSHSPGCPHCHPGSISVTEHSLPLPPSQES